MTMKQKSVLITGLLVVALLGLGWAAYRVISGRFLGLSQFKEHMQAVVGSVIGHPNVVSQNKNEFSNIIFIHHSVGNNLIHQGNLREQFQQFGYFFWDQDYLDIGLTQPDGMPAGYSYDIPGDNTDIDGYVMIFQQPVLVLPVNAFSALLQHEVIIFKSCFPNSQIADNATLEWDKQEYLIIRQSIDQHPDHIFFLVTSPPLNPAETDKSSAQRARELNTWLASPEFTDGHPNLFVYNLFDFLAEGNPTAEDTNMLKLAFRDGSDSHPNSTANQQVAPLLAKFVAEKIDQFRKIYQ